MNVSATHPCQLLSDAELVRKALMSERAALRHLIDRIIPIAKPRIDGVIRRSFRRGHKGISAHMLREDALQDFLFSLFKDDAALLRDWDPKRSAQLGPYIGAIAAHVALNAVAKHRRRLAHEQSPSEGLIEATASPYAVSSPEGKTAHRELTEALLKDLTPKDQAKVVAYFFERNSARELAEKFGGTAHAIHVWASRMRERLQAKYQALLPSES